jgi:hypothetical protein
MNERYLTKSRFKLGMECPTKLFYTAKKHQYYDSKLDDSFLLSLAEGGFQVGELAKQYYPGGINIDDLDYQASLEQTNLLLKQENVIIFEAAFQFQNLFIRADIVVKEGARLELIEVKAKSFDPDSDKFMGPRAGILAKWRPYLQDIAFQKYVVTHSLPDLKVNAYLLLTDKSKSASIDGLNQFFFLSKENGRQKCTYNGPADKRALGNEILVKVNVDAEIEHLFSVEQTELKKTIHQFADNYEKDILNPPVFGKRCGKCEFRVPDGSAIELKSGFHECWLTTGHSLDELKQPMVIDLWNSTKKDELIARQLYFLKQLSEADIEPKKTIAWPHPWLSKLERQMLQVNNAKTGNQKAFIDKNGLLLEMKSLKFPLHFIDFETTTVAIPFYRGRRPYETIAFQFSHHILYEGGAYEHRGQWINTVAGVFPNFEFVRALKKELDTDDGTIFRYADHENTVLRQIHTQLVESQEPDKDMLCSWIDTITQIKSDDQFGHRNMVDMLELVKRYYLDPKMGGSNSLKKVLPSILASSEFLQKKYAVPVYGDSIPSLNFQPKAWLVRDDSGQWYNPYGLLEKIHEGFDNEAFDELITDEESGIMDGGAAMIAYARMQFTQMKEPERQQINKALLRYCELDTLAMVMLYEAWREWCK